MDEFYGICFTKLKCLTARTSFYVRNYICHHFLKFMLDIWDIRRIRMGRDHHVLIIGCSDHFVASLGSAVPYSLDYCEASPSHYTVSPVNTLVKYRLYWWLLTILPFCRLYRNAFKLVIDHRPLRSVLYSALVNDAAAVTLPDESVCLSVLQSSHFLVEVYGLELLHGRTSSPPEP